MKTTSRWEKALAIMCHVLILVLSLAVFGSVIQNESSDLSIHTVYARQGNFHELDSFFHQTANPMWHVLVVLLSMTGGVHLHTLRCPDEETFRRIEAALEQAGLLYHRE